MKQITIEINNCKLDKCPHFTISKTDSTDGFDKGEYWHCKKADKEIEPFVEWHEEKKVPIPEWCPCKQQNSNADNLTTSNNQLKDLHIRFLSDRRIKALQNEIAAIYNIAIPKVLINTDGCYEITYDENTEYEANRVKKIIEDIIKSDYSDLAKYLNTTAE